MENSINSPRVSTTSIVITSGIEVVDTRGEFIEFSILNL
ncbi:unnamed protein product, partial [Rotaria sp. Silwood1]